VTTLASVGVALGVVHHAVGVNSSAVKPEREP
jgi:hypothetical protein